MSFKSWRSYWDFCYSVKNRQRYIISEEDKDFLESILNTCQDRIRTISSGATVWRAQLGYDVRPIYQTDPSTEEEIYIDDEPIPYSFSRMKPLSDSASEGRANPKGIPYLYVASDKKTAMSEVRPWLDSTLSVGTFRIIKDLKILDFSVEHGNKSKFFIFEEPSDQEKIQTVWCDIDNAFSKPTTKSDSGSEYVPTQIISEFIKLNGFDGIAYKSSLADGYNLVLFDLSSANVISCYLYNTTKLKFDFERQ